VREQSSTGILPVGFGTGAFSLKSYRLETYATFELTRGAWICIRVGKSSSFYKRVRKLELSLDIM